MADETPLSIDEPEGTPKGGVVLVQEAFGVNGHIRDVGGRLAAEGWLTVTPHLFHRTGDPALGHDDFSLVIPHMKELRSDQILDDVDAALEAITERGITTDHVGIVGFCMGGTVAIAVGARRGVGAAVTFYGGGLAEGRWGFDPLVEEAARLRCPWLGLFGDQDQGIPVDDVERLRAAAATSGQPTEVVRYAEAGHGFNCDRRASYHEPSATDAWRRTLEFFTTHL